MFLCLYFCLSVFLSFCLSVFLSFCLSVFLSLCICVFLSFCLSVPLSLSVCLSQSVFLSFCLSGPLSLCLFISVCLSLSLPLFSLKTLYRATTYVQQSLFCDPNGRRWRQGWLYSQTCIQRPPLGPEKSGSLKEGPDKTEIYTCHWCIKLAVVNRWPLFTGGH